MPPNAQQTVKRYQDALAFAPSPGFPSRWPPGTGPRQTPAQRRRRFHGPVHSPAVHSPAKKFVAMRAAPGLGDDSVSSGGARYGGQVFTSAPSPATVSSGGARYGGQVFTSAPSLATVSSGGARYGGQVFTSAQTPAWRWRQHHFHRLADGDGLGGWADDLLNIGKGAVASDLQPVADKLTNLEIAIKTILVLSAIAAGTGVLGVMRR